MRLIPIDLRKAIENTHPDINTESWFIAEIQFCKGTSFWAGKFSKQWYGFNFNAEGFPYSAGLQFDAPGQNCSDWKRLWKVEGKDGHAIMATIVKLGIKQLLMQQKVNK
mgnify:FL=1